MQGHKSERTEKPTARRLRDARERGQVARSRDMASALSFLGITILIGWYGAVGASRFGGRLSLAFADIGQRGRVDLESGPVAALILSDVWFMFTILGPLVLVGAAFSIATSVAQTGGMFATKALELNWGKLSPAKGFSKFSPLQAGGELVKAVVGILTVGTLCYFIVRPLVETAPVLAMMAPLEAVGRGWESVSTLMWRAGILLIVLALGDFVLQKKRVGTQLKMTKKEVKDDLRAEEGSPHMKAKVRRIQREMIRRRMMQAVKTATVVITNPTHVSVALQYDRAEMHAPVVVAKGHDDIALRIRALAREHGVPIVENVELARALDRATDIGDTIPADLFGAVAEVLAYLVRMKQLAL